MALTFDQLAQYRGLLSMVDGSFDCLHPGHLAYFRAARSLGYPLLCNVCPDSETVTKHPILQPAADRAQILEALEILTYVHVSERPTVEILRQLQPAFYVKGTDWIDKLPVEIGQVCAELGIRIRYTATKTHSSSDLLSKFQPDVDAFEALVQSQPEADKLWDPVTPFDLEARRPIEGPHPQRILDTFSPTRILDAGCGSRAILVKLLQELGAKVTGGDVQGKYPLVRYLNLTERPGGNDDEDSLGDFLGARFDLVICREVLEHLPVRHFQRAVSNLCWLSSKYVYGTTRFHPTPKHVLDFTTEFNVDPTHISCGTKEFLRVLFALEGFTYRADLAEEMDWRGLHRTFVFERAA